MRVKNKVSVISFRNLSNIPMLLINDHQYSIDHSNIRGATSISDAFISCYLLWFKALGAEPLPVEPKNYAEFEEFFPAALKRMPDGSEWLRYMGMKQ